MYESRFGISGPPFQLSPDPGFYFDSRGHHEALADLRACLTADAGLIVLSGEIGAGKTTLIRTLLAEIDPAALSVSSIVSSQLDATDLLASALIGFGIQAESTTREALENRLVRYLLRLRKLERRAVILVDEAQNLHADAFEEIAALAAQARSRPLPLHICLVGQPELRSLLDEPELRSLRDRADTIRHLGPIGPEEVQPYVEHRLRRVGWSGQPRFDADTFAEIHRWTGGIPRRVNQLCNRLLLTCYLTGDPHIDVAAVSQTAADLRAELGDTAPVPDPTPTPRPVRALSRPSAAATARGDGPADAGPRPLLCLAATLGDHVRAAALMHALAARPGVPAAWLLRPYDDDALEICHRLFKGLQLDQRLLGLGLPEQANLQRQSTPAQLLDGVIEHVRPSAIVVFEGSATGLTLARQAQAAQVPLVRVGAAQRRAPAADGLADAEIDAGARLLYTAAPEASEQLAREGRAPERIHCVGSLLMDAVRIAQAQEGEALTPGEPTHPASDLQIDRAGYALVVLSDAANLSMRQSAGETLEVLLAVSRDLRLVWPMRACVRDQLARLRLLSRLSSERIRLMPAQPHPIYLAMLRNATCVVTDSWNVQEEAAGLGVACITVGVAPAEPVTVAAGCNAVVGNTVAAATRAAWDCIFNGGPRGRIPDLWDGRTGPRVAAHLQSWLASEGGRAAGP